MRVLKTGRLNIRLNVEDRKWLDRRAKRQRNTLTDVVEQLIFHERRREAEISFPKESKK